MIRAHRWGADTGGLRHAQAMAYGHNIFWGKRYLDHGGPFRVACASTGAAMQGSIDHSLFRRSTKQARTRR